MLIHHPNLADRSCHANVSFSSIPNPFPIHSQSIHHAHNVSGIHPSSIEDAGSICVATSPWDSNETECSESSMIRKKVDLAYQEALKHHYTRFIHKMGPYYRQAKKEKQEEVFFAAAFSHYCDRFPDTQRYLDLDYRKHKYEHIKNRMIIKIKEWSGLHAYSSIAEPHMHWRTFFNLGPIDAAPGTTSDNPIVIDDDSAHIQPRPRPRPRKRAKIAAESDSEEKEALPSSSAGETMLASASETMLASAGETMLAITEGSAVEQGI
ncbi:hypothetical protein BJ912DRAFT_1063618 [Pholiota molesta]|nr:hypothetical protein BJ912DRAFT_1063618 [Pholiota molesta]